MHIVWLKTEFLHPVDKGGRIRTYQMLRALHRTHRITYLTLDDGQAAPNALELAREYAHEVIRVPFHIAPKGSLPFYGELFRNVFSTLPYSLWRYRVPGFGQEVERLATRADVDVVVCDFLTPAVNLPRRLARPSVLFQHNVEAEIWRRHAAAAGNPVSRAYFSMQWRRMMAFEGEACRRFDEVVTVSEADRTHLGAAYSLPSVSDVPTGVDTEYFRPIPNVARRPYNLVFTGSMDWMPNEDGILLFAEQVFPAVRRILPQATLTVVGRNPPLRIRSLATDESGIEVTGTVPDVRPYLSRASGFVVPLRIGGGTRLKIYEAMAMGCPVVSTTIGAEGLPLTPGEHLRIADTPSGLVDACVDILRDHEGSGAMAGRAAILVRQQFGWDRVAATFAAICEATISRVRQPTRVPAGNSPRPAAASPPSFRNQDTA